MRVDDVFRDLARHVGFYLRDMLSDVPPVPGVYAWYYPLQVTQRDLSELVAELNAVYFFDARTGCAPGGSAQIDLAWRKIGVNVLETPARTAIAPGLEDSWRTLLKSDTRFHAFRRSLMASSILMPPLYVGKTNSLQRRCWDHVRGTDEHSFHARFEDYAARCGLKSRRVKDLLFACVHLPEDDHDEVDADATDVAPLLEALLQIAARPPYGAR